MLPLAVLTFFGAFVPIAGGVLAGFAAAMVALVTEGFVTAAFVVGAVTLVQQAESNLLQPVMSRAVKLHPVATLLAVTAGSVIWGIIGAFLAVPLTAVAAASARPAVTLLRDWHSARPSR